MTATEPPGAAKAPTMDEHIFRWFNDRHPDLMAECLKDYPDDDPEYAALVEADRAALTKATGGAS